MHDFFNGKNLKNLNVKNLNPINLLNDFCVSYDQKKEKEHRVSSFTITTIINVKWLFIYIYIYICVCVK
jgi:hypothetical protein